ncbi:hypothetical protein J6590_030949 [Homalodisca vitripennis]|nr:hypothetical protein J6590_030949 [Homalodisca vitripennis]
MSMPFRLVLEPYPYWVSWAYSIRGDYSQGRSLEPTNGRHSDRKVVVGTAFSIRGDYSQGRSLEPTNGRHSDRKVVVATAFSIRGDYSQGRSLEPTNGRHSDRKVVVATAGLVDVLGSAAGADTRISGVLQFSSSTISHASLAVIDSQEDVCSSVGVLTLGVIPAASSIARSGRTMPLPASSSFPLLSGSSGDAAATSLIASLSCLIITTSSSATATTLSVDLWYPASP